ncbi:hypothetical protein NKG05_04730 [Oerskovia sp. M15]
MIIDAWRGPPMRAVESWARALPHRDGAELSAAANRLESVGATPDEAGCALADLGDSLYERASSARTRQEFERDAVLFVELAAYLAYAQERAASGRRSVINELLRDSSLASAASLLG